jgi:glycosyltransferase involved in cell wall biosynthesis
LKIAQVNSYYYPFMIGGAEWYVRNISRELSKAGNDVTVFTASEWGKQKAAADEVFEGVKIRRLPLKLDLTYRLKLWEGLREELAEGDFDIVHTYDYAQQHSVDSLRAASEGGIGSALTVFDVHSTIPRAWYKRVPMMYLDSYFAHRTFPLATRILVRAPNLVEGLPGLNGFKSKVRVSPSGARDESFGRFDGEKFRQKHSIGTSPVVLFMGRLNPLKGPQLLLEAAPGLAREFPGTAFVFVGPDQGGYGSFLKRRASELGVASSVRFTGIITDFEEKMQAYSACDVFVLPTSYEGTSQAIFEAMSQGKPVVASRVGGVPFQIEDGKQGYLVEYGNVNELSERIAQVLRGGEEIREMGRQARARAEDFRYSKLVRNLQSVYQEITGIGN